MKERVSSRCHHYLDTLLELIRDLDSIVSDRDLELERRKIRELHEIHKANAKAYNKLKVSDHCLLERYKHRTAEAVLSLLFT